MAGTGRVYLPVTWELLAELDDRGEVRSPVEPVAALAVGEEAEYAALQQAADLSAALLEVPGRRVVVVAEVPLETPAVSPVVSLRQVVAVHVDDAEVDPAYLHDDHVAEPPDLGWWATQEIPRLLGRD